MLTDKYIEHFLELYFKGELSQEDKDKLFEALRINPSLYDTVEFVLHKVDPHKAKQFLTEKSLMCDTIVMSEEDETKIELYISGMMTPEEEKQFREELVANDDLRVNSLALSFLYKAIKKIQQQDEKTLKSAKDVSSDDIKSLFEEFKTEDDDDLIDRYLKDELSSEEVTEFENRLNTDKEFRQRAGAIAMLAKGVSCCQQNDTKAILDAGLLTAQEINNETGTPVAASLPPAASTSGGKIIPLWTRRIAAAAVVVIVCGIGFDYYNSNTANNLAGQGLEMASSDISGPIITKGSDDGSVVRDLRTLFVNVKEKKDLTQTIIKLENYYNSAIDEYADIEDDFVDQISLALATAYIYNGDKSKAKEVLNHIIADNDANDKVKQKAKKILSSLNKTFIF